jgi:hypothetical protein
MFASLALGDIKLGNVLYSDYSEPDVKLYVRVSSVTLNCVCMESLTIH